MSVFFNQTIRRHPWSTVALTPAWRRRYRCPAQAPRISAGEGYLIPLPQNGTNEKSADAQEKPISEEPISAPPSPVLGLDSVSLDQMLETFQKRENPYDRVFAGLVREVASLESQGLASHQEGLGMVPVISGVADPGAEVRVIFEDDIGLKQYETVVHAGIDGHWLAPGNQASSTVGVDRVVIEIRNPSWSGPNLPERYDLNFPYQALLDQGSSDGSDTPRLLGTVIQPVRLDTDSLPDTPSW